MALLNNIINGKEKSPQQRGKLIVIDGSDGSGKSAQVDLLVETLQLNNYPLEILSFPREGDTSSAPLEEYLDGGYGKLSPQGQAVFYALDHLGAKNQINQWLSEGKIVIANRYVTASAGNLGGQIENDAERIRFFKWLDNLEYMALGVPKPDLTLILHTPAKFAHLSDKHELYDGDFDYVAQVEQAFLHAAQLFPNTKLVECVEQGQLLTAGQIHGKVWDLTRRIALKNYSHAQ
nr:Thymidylate kinase [uncultured bacterium]